MDINYRFVRSTFCGMTRVIHHEAGHAECRHIHRVTTQWFNIDDILGVVSAGKPAQASCELFGDVDAHGVPVAEMDPFGAHAGQTVRLGVCSLPPRDYERGQEIFTACVLFVTDVDAAETKRLVGTCRATDNGEQSRVYHVRGQDGKQYAIALNLGDGDLAVTVDSTPNGRLLTPKAARLTAADGRTQLRIVPRGCALLAL